MRQCSPFKFFFFSLQKVGNANTNFSISLILAHFYFNIDENIHFLALRVMSSREGIQMESNIVHFMGRLIVMSLSHKKCMHVSALGVLGCCTLMLYQGEPISLITKELIEKVYGLKLVSEKSIF